MIIDVFYSSKNGPSEIFGIKFKTNSPQGSLRLSKQGLSNELQKQLKQIQQDLKQSQSDTRKCDKMYDKDFFSLCNSLGCEIIGTQQEQQKFLQNIEIDTQIQDATKILHDDCGAQIWSVALFRDSKFYYNIECVRTWPGYQP